MNSRARKPLASAKPIIAAFRPVSRPLNPSLAPEASLPARAFISSLTYGGSRYLRVAWAFPVRTVARFLATSTLAPSDRITERRA